MENGKIYLTKERLEKIESDVKKLQVQLLEIGKHKGELKLGLSSEGNYCDVDYEFSSSEYERISRKISDILRIIDNAIIITASHDETKADVGDVVTIREIYAEGQEEVSTCRLVAALVPDIFAEIPEITIKSPIGKSIYGKMIGERTKVQGIEAETFVEILDINNSKEKESKVK